MSVTGCTFVDADLRVPPILLLNFLKSWFNASKSGFECRFESGRRMSWFGSALQVGSDDSGCSDSLVTIALRQH